MRLVYGALLFVSILSWNEARACGERAALSYAGSYKLATHLAGKELNCLFEGYMNKAYVRMKNEKCGGWITYVSIRTLGERFAVRDIKKKDKQNKYLVETIDEHSAPLLCEISK